MKKKNVIVDRWKSEMDPFWIRVRSIGVSIASSGVIILGVSEIPGVQLPQPFVVCAGIMIAVGSVMAGQSQLTKK